MKSPLVLPSRCQWLRSFTLEAVQPHRIDTLLLISSSPAQTHVRTRHTRFHPRPISECCTSSTPWQTPGLCKQTRCQCTINKTHSQVNGIVYLGLIRHTEKRTGVNLLCILTVDCSGIGTGGIIASLVGATVSESGMSSQFPHRLEHEAWHNQQT